MKKLILLACFGIFLMVNLSGQKLDFTYRLDSIKIENTYQYKISVTITKGEGPYTYMLFKGEPWKGGVVFEESKKTTASTYLFEKTINGNNFHIGVKGLTAQDANWKYINLNEQK